MDGHGVEVDGHSTQSGRSKSAKVDGLKISRVVQIKVILFLKSMSEKVGSDIKRL